MFEVGAEGQGGQETLLLQKATAAMRKKKPHEVCRNLEKNEGAVVAV